jgi:hypothetical protein
MDHGVVVGNNSSEDTPAGSPFPPPRQGGDKILLVSNNPHEMGAARIRAKGRHFEQGPAV